MTKQKIHHIIDKIHYSMIGIQEVVMMTNSNNTYLPRLIEKPITESMKTNGCIVIEGPKGGVENQQLQKDSLKVLLNFKNQLPINNIEFLLI